jgi:intracellular multiplication protein IcmD
MVSLVNDRDVFIKRLFSVLLVMVFSMAVVSFAKDTQTLGGVAHDIQGSFANIAKLITGAAYIAGFGFAFAAILKFKAHKDNPTQIPVGTPIALLFVAAALIFLPSVFGVAGQTVFGTGISAGGVGGVSAL